MSLIPAADQAKLRADFAALSRPVRLVFFTKADGHDTCAQARQVIDELPPLSDKISIEEIDLQLEPDRAAAYAIDRVPAIAVVGHDDDGLERDSHIRFLGTPAGYEFISLVRAILLVGVGESGLTAESRAHVAAVDRPMIVHVFTTPTCPHCPRAVILAHEMAFLNPNITAYAVEATEYPDLAQQYRVTGVPKTVIDNRIEILGAVPEAEFIAQALGLTDDAPTLNPDPTY